MESTNYDELWMDTAPSAVTAMTSGTPDTSWNGMSQVL